MLQYRAWSSPRCHPMHHSTGQQLRWHRAGTHQLCHRHRHLPLLLQAERDVLVVAEIVGAGVVKSAVGEPHGVTPNCVWGDMAKGQESAPPLPCWHLPGWLSETPPHSSPASCLRTAHPRCWAASPGQGRGTGRTPGSSSLHLRARGRHCSGTLSLSPPIPPACQGFPLHKTGPRFLIQRPHLGKAANYQTLIPHPPPPYPPWGSPPTPCRRLGTHPCPHPPSRLSLGHGQQHLEGLNPSREVPPKSSFLGPLQVTPEDPGDPWPWSHPIPQPLTLLQAGHQLVDDVLHDTVQLEVEQGLRLVDLGVAHGAVLAGLQVLDDAALADWEQREGVSGWGAPSVGCQDPSPRAPRDSHVCRHSVMVVASMK